MQVWKAFAYFGSILVIWRGLLFQELEKELELQVSLKQEMETAMKLLEKDTHEKQDTLAALRQQLEEVKAINLQMFHKFKVRHGGDGAGWQCTIGK